MLVRVTARYVSCSLRLWLATNVEVRQLSRCRDAQSLDNGFVDSSSPPTTSQVQRLPIRKESHQNHGGVEPCSGHLNTCCKVSFVTTDPPVLQEPPLYHVGRVAAIAWQHDGSVDGIRTSLCTSFFRRIKGNKMRNMSRLGKAEQKMPAYAPLRLAGLSEFSLCSRVVRARRLWLLACVPVF